MMGFLKTVPANLIILVLIASSSLAQPVGAQAQKVDEFGNIRADDAMALLDHFAKVLADTPNARGYLIGHSQKGYPVGLFLRGLYGYRDYLINSRGIMPSRIEVVAGGDKDKITMELWLVPEDASPPKPDSELTVSPTAPIRFDTVYPDCPSEFSIHLEELDDYLRFYAEALRDNPNARSSIIVYPGKRSRLNKAERMARDIRGLLMKNYNISAARVVAKAMNRRRECSEIELWIVPTSAVPAGAAPNNGMHPTRFSADAMRKIGCCSQSSACG